MVYLRRCYYVLSAWGHMSSQVDLEHLILFSVCINWRKFNILPNGHSSRIWVTRLNTYWRSTGILGLFPQYCAFIAWFILTLQKSAPAVFPSVHLVFLVSDILPKRTQTTKILLLPWGSNILTLAAGCSSLTKTNRGGQVMACIIILEIDGKPGVGNSIQVGQSPPCFTPLNTATVHNCGLS